MSYDKILKSKSIIVSVEGPQKNYEYTWEIVSISEDSMEIKLSF